MFFFFSPVLRRFEFSSNCICQRALKKLRCIKKNQRVCLGFVSGSLERTGGEAVRADSGDNTSDMHTKPLPTVAFTKLRTEIEVVADGRM